MFCGSRVQDKIRTCNANLIIGRSGRRSFQISIGSYSPYFVVIKNQKVFIELL